MAEFKGASAQCNLQLWVEREVQGGDGTWMHVRCPWVRSQLLRCWRSPWKQPEHLEALKWGFPHKLIMKKSLLNFSQFGIQSNLIDAALMQGELVGRFHWRVKNTEEKLGLYVRRAFSPALMLMQGKVISLNAGAARYSFRGINNPTDTFPPPPASVRLPFCLGGSRADPPVPGRRGSVLGWALCLPVPPAPAHPGSGRWRLGIKMSLKRK